jgi:hypothetical protein
MRFSRYIGIDYSGAKTADSRLRTLQVYAAGRKGEPSRVAPAGGGRHWSRREVAHYCLEALTAGPPVIIGLDHGFSFPLAYMQRFSLASWDVFLRDFVRHWPTADAQVTVEALREGNPRSGQASELRLCEAWTATAKSVFLFDVQGAVAKSTHAGLAWLHWLRTSTEVRRQTHFWPFEGFEVPAGKSLVVEAYPSLYRRRYRKAERTADEQDAWSVAAWLQEADRRGSLENYLVPPLTAEERKQAKLEGWILGVW